jgi:hypothetical protein
MQFAEATSRNAFQADNAPDDRAGASKFSIRKRPIPRFGPSDCSSTSLIELLQTFALPISRSIDILGSKFQLSIETTAK